MAKHDRVITDDELDYLQEHVAAGRRAAFEEAAKLVDAFAADNSWQNNALLRTAAAAIRELAAKETP